MHVLYLVTLNVLYACQIPVCCDHALHQIDRFTRCRRTHAGDSLSPSAVLSLLLIRARLEMTRRKAAAGSGGHG
jgi:hypothetical protein